MENIYTLHCRGAAGEEVRYFYNPHTSELVDEDGAPVFERGAARAFADATRVSPANPGRKSSAPATLKIQLGLRCNYSCSYCNQASHVGSEAVTKTSEADVFLAGLGRWLTGAPKRIEFWGGEPFLYFAKLKRLVPDLHARFPEAELIIVTNGSLEDPNDGPILRDRLDSICDEFAVLPYSVLQGDKKARLNIVPNDWPTIRSLLGPTNA